MTDYIAALNDQTSPYHREACNLGARVLDSSEVTVIEGVIRWRSNGRVPPQDVVLLAASLDPAISAGLCKSIRLIEDRAAIADYVRNQPLEMSAENLAEARAAVGPGVTLTDIFTGRTFTT